MSTMIQPTKNRHGVYTLRMAVPAELKDTLGKGELKRSLKTKDLAEAKRKAPAITALMQAEIELARKALINEQTVTNDDIERIASVWLTSILSQPELIKERYLWEYPHGLDFTLESRAISNYLEQNDSTDTNYYDSSAFWSELSDAEPRSSYLEKTQRDIEILQLVKNELAEALGLVPAELTPKWKIELAWRLAEYRNQAAGMLVVGIFPQYKTTETQDETRASISFCELFDEYKEQIFRDEPERAEKRIKEYSTAANRFSEFIGLKTIEEISKEDIMKFRSLMEKQPLRPTKATKKLTLQQQAELTGDKLSPQRVRNLLMALSAIFRVAVENGLLQANPISEIPKKKRQRSNNHYAFSESEVTTIFNLPLFEGEESPHGAMAYWVPIILYYTGARVEEICQLYKQNIIDDNGIPCILVEMGENQSVKTGNTRTIPLHNHLIELGFMDYVNSRENYLFSGQRNAAGKYSYNFIRWFGQYIRKHGIDNPEIKPTHSFRHTFITYCRNRGEREDVQNSITGHAQGSVGRGYGAYTTPMKKELIDRTPKLNLSPLNIWNGGNS
ncbi:TPA: tyrosine-type recombinase/integrase [Providencia stuartii]|nr:tyrosine-type recombinase/integrase [Providencia stuartii]